MYQKTPAVKYLLVIGVVSLVLFAAWRPSNNSRELPRDHLILKPGRETDEMHSTCSARSDGRGFHQSVIAYSLYGNLSRADIRERYVNPLLETARSATFFYPDWIVRIYHNVRADDEASLRLLQQSFGHLEHVDLCNASRVLADLALGSVFAMTWRFLPVLDPLVDRFLSRDADSPLLQREVDAVAQWLASNKTFHVLRDHPGHCIPILGGLWGVQLKNPRRAKVVHVTRKMLLSHHLHKVGFDQTLLSVYLWPYVKVSSMAHDSYCCSAFKDSRPFPTQRSGDAYLGVVTSWNESRKPLEPCPMQCRPSYGRHWEFC